MMSFRIPLTSRPMRPNMNCFRMYVSHTDVINGSESSLLWLSSRINCGSCWYSERRVTVSPDLPPKQKPKNSILTTLLLLLLPHLLTTHPLLHISKQYYISRTNSSPSSFPPI